MTKSVAYHSASRRPKKRWRTGVSGAEDISYASDGVQQFFFKRTIDLLTQPAHEHIDDVRLRIERVFPHTRQNHRLGDDAPDVAHQVLEQREFARSKVEHLVAPGDAPGQQVEAQIFDSECGGLGSTRRTAHERL